MTTPQELSHYFLQGFTEARLQRVATDADALPEASREPLAAAFDSWLAAHPGADPEIAYKGGVVCWQLVEARGDSPILDAMEDW